MKLSKVEPECVHLEAIRERLRRAYTSPERDWYACEDENCWMLFADGEPRISPQILKAPKTGTPYAEYWPDEPNTEFIVYAKADIRFLLQEVDRLTRLVEEKK